MFKCSHTMSCCCSHRVWFKVYLTSHSLLSGHHLLSRQQAHWTLNEQWTFNIDHWTLNEHCSNHLQLFATICTILIFIILFFNIATAAEAETFEMLIEHLTLNIAAIISNHFHLDLQSCNSRRGLALCPTFEMLIENLTLDIAVIICYQLPPISSSWFSICCDSSTSRLLFK